MERSLIFFRKKQSACSGKQGFWALLAIVAIAAFASGNSWGADDGNECATADLTKDDPSVPVSKRPLSVMPILDQGSTGTCFAHVAAELVDAWRFSHGDTDYSQLTDPIALAVSSKRQDKEVKLEYRPEEGCVKRPFQGEPGNLHSSWDAGRLDFAFEAAKMNGSCPRSLITDPLVKKDSTNGLSQHFASIKDLLQQYKYLENLKLDHAQVERDIGEFNWDGLPQSFASATLCQIMRDHYGLRRIQFPDSSWMNEVLKKQNPIILLDEVVKQTCNGSGKIKKPELPKLNFNVANDPAQIEMWIREKFSSEKGSPLALNLCSEALKSKTFSLSSPLSQSSPTQQGCGNTKPACEIHSVLLAGRRRDQRTGKCQFLIRSTWGPNACKERKQWDCSPKGDFWVDANTVYRHTADIFSFGN